MREALRALVSLAGPESTTTVKKFAFGKSSIDLKSVALELLDRVDMTDEDVTELVNISMHAENANVRSAAILVLPRIVTTMPVDQATVIIDAGLSSEKGLVRTAAIRSVSRMKEIGDRLVPELAQMAVKDSEVSVRQAAIQALVRLGADETIRGKISEYCSDPDPAVRRSAVAAIGSVLGDRLGMVILSRDADASGPWLDPRSPITYEHMQKASARLRVPIDVIRQRIIELASIIPLIIEEV
jgi:HEAT repeat protein